MTAIFTLTLRQLAGSRRWWLVLVLSALPLLIAGLFHVAESHLDACEFADDIMRTLIASAILPLVMLLLGRRGVRQRVGDRTLVYLMTKPGRAVADRAAEAAAMIVVGGVRRGQRPAFRWRVAKTVTPGARSRPASACSAGAAAYAAIFTWAGLATHHALVLGLVYVFVWEATLAAYLDGVRFLSVRRFTLGLIHGLDQAPLASVDISLSSTASRSSWDGARRLHRARGPQARGSTCPSSAQQEALAERVVGVELEDGPAGPEAAPSTSVTTAGMLATRASPTMRPWNSVPTIDRWRSAAPRGRRRCASSSASRARCPSRMVSGRPRRRRRP